MKLSDIRELPGALVLSAVLLLSAPAIVAAEGTIPSPQESPSMQHAAGSFDVSMTPIEGAVEGGFAAMALEKTYRGDLVGTASGRMMTAMTETKGSAGYVAVERVTGELHGREGSFVLQHFGLMDRGAPSLTVRIVPDSGTGELAGIRGTLDIIIDADGHRYTLDYTLDAGSQ